MGDLPRMVVVKITLTVAALVLLVIGIRTGVEAYRWAAIVLVAISFLLRFVGPRKPPAP